VRGSFDSPRHSLLWAPSAWRGRHLPGDRRQGGREVRRGDETALFQGGSLDKQDALLELVRGFGAREVPVD
jgi:hypothetical protein